MAEPPPSKIGRQIDKAGLPRGGTFPFIPSLDKDKQGRDILSKGAVQYGPKQGKKGYVDSGGRIWIKDHAHAGIPEHWDVQENGGKSYFRVDPNGNLIP
jgi:hypothetical protein